MGKIKVIVENYSGFENPEYKTIGSAGMDVKADLKRTFGWGSSNSTDKVQPLLNSVPSELPYSCFLNPHQIQVFKTGLFVEIPEGYEIQVRSRSGLSVQGIVVMNAPGTIDSDYRGEIGVILGNLTDKKFKINHGDRIAQLVLCPVYQVEWDMSKPISETFRGQGGFGSTGK